MVKLQIFLTGLLLIGIVLVSGCAEEAGSSENAIKLADESAFGKYAVSYGDMLERGNNCDFNMLVSTLEKSMEQLGRLRVMTEEEKDSLEPHFDNVKQCWPSFEKKVEKIGGNKYRVTYSIESTSDCKELVEQLISANHIHNQAVLVDLKTKEVEMPDAPAIINSWETAYEQLETSTKETEETFGEDAESMIDCSMIGDFAMFQQGMESVTQQPSSSEESMDNIAQQPSSSEGIKGVALVDTIETADECETVTEIPMVRDLCYRDFAVRTKDSSLCEEKIIDSSTKNICYKRVAIETKDVKLCEEITDSGMKERCYADIE